MNRTLCQMFNTLSYLSSIQSLSRVQLFATPWTTAHQASLSITDSWSLLKLMSIRSVMPSNHLIPCRPLLLPPSIFPSIRVFSNESALHIRWPEYWSFSFSISPSNEYSGLISNEYSGLIFRTDWISLQSKGLSRIFSNTTVQNLVLTISPGRRPDYPHFTDWENRLRVKVVCQGSHC